MKLSKKKDLLTQSAKIDIIRSKIYFGGILNQKTQKNNTLVEKILKKVGKDSSLKNKDIVLLLHIAQEAQHNSGFYDTSANELKEVINCARAETVSRTLHRLANAGYINISLVSDAENRKKHHYRLYVISSKRQTSTAKNLKIIKKKSDDFSKEKKPKNTTVQDMLVIFNRITGAAVTFADAYKSNLMRYMYYAFKTKFKNLENWEKYVKHSVFGKIKNAKKFLFYILSLEKIDAVLANFVETVSTAVSSATDTVSSAIDKTIAFMTKSTLAEEAKNNFALATATACGGVEDTSISNTCRNLIANTVSCMKSKSLGQPPSFFSEEEKIRNDIESLEVSQAVKDAHFKLLKIGGVAGYKNWMPHIKIVDGTWGVSAIPSDFEKDDFAARYVNSFYL